VLFWAAPTRICISGAGFEITTVSGVVLVGAEGCVCERSGAWCGSRLSHSCLAMPNRLPQLPATVNMILTQCAVCATDLGLSLGKKCGRCRTRYCGAECQKQHWEQGGHDKLCKLIKKAGGAEQYNANTKYAEAVAVAAEACAEDTRGQTCYICTQALHWKTKEGLVRMCACRGTAGFAHVSCLAEQAKILWEEAEANNLDVKVQETRWRRWDTCGLCNQQYHGGVRCALGWACWKTYVGRPENNDVRNWAMHSLGTGLSAALRHEEALSVKEAELSMERRIGAPAAHVLATQTNLANTYETIGRLEEALSLRQEMYSGRLKSQGEQHRATLVAASNYASTLFTLKRFEEAKSLMRKTIPVAQRVVGESNELTLKMRLVYADALYKDDGATLDDLREAVTTLKETVQTARRVFGGAHPTTTGIEGELRHARAVLVAREAGFDSVREALEAMTAGDSYDNAGL
jgi:tetratricopeptide (TPR) repeat protein